jgi:hypothetical protein
MCSCNNCNELTLFKGTDGVGISSIVPNNDGTLTFYYTNGTSYTSPNLTGPQGPSGAAGAPGTNAFKFIKDFSAELDGGELVITRAELTSCSSVPNGCIGEYPAGFTNLQVQVWLRDNEPPSPSGPWKLALSGDTLDSVEIDNSTGTITVTLTGGSTAVLARVVVIA